MCRNVHKYLSFFLALSGSVGGDLGCRLLPFLHSLCLSTTLTDFLPKCHILLFLPFFWPQSKKWNQSVSDKEAGRGTTVLTLGTLFGLSGPILAFLFCNTRSLSHWPQWQKRCLSPQLLSRPWLACLPKPASVFQKYILGPPALQRVISDISLGLMDGHDLSNHKYADKTWSDDAKYRSFGRSHCLKSVVGNSPLMREGPRRDQLDDRELCKYGPHPGHSPAIFCICISICICNCICFCICICIHEVPVEISLTTVKFFPSRTSPYFFCICIIICICTCICICICIHEAPVEISLTTVNCALACLFHPGHSPTGHTITPAAFSL